MVLNDNRAQIEQAEVNEALAEAYNEDYYSNYLNLQNQSQVPFVQAPASILQGDEAEPESAEKKKRRKKKKSEVPSTIPA